MNRSTDLIPTPLERARRALARALGAPSRELAAAEAAARAAECARLELRGSLAELAYELALGHLAEAERASARVFVLSATRPADAVRRDFRETATRAVSLAAGTPERAAWTAIARLRERSARARARSRAWCVRALTLACGRHAGAVELLAAHLVLEGDAAAALVAYDHLASSALDAPGRARSLSNRAKALLDLGCADAAIRSSQEAARLDPDHAVALANLAVARLAQGGHAEGVGAYARVDELCARRPERRGALARLARADLRWLARRGGRRRAALGSAIRDVLALPFLADGRGEVRR